MRIFTTLDDVAAAAGCHLGTTDWVSIDQDRIDRFAEATGDHQWIHVDRERAQFGPFGGTIAHGYLTLSLLPWLGSQVFRFETPGARLNYGTNRVRFPSPVRAGERVRLQAALSDVVDVPAGTQLTLVQSIEIEDQDKPACVAETLVLLIP
jgi:acyl dehydratase